MIGSTDLVPPTCTYWKIRGSSGEPAIKGLVFPVQLVAGGPGGQAATGVLSTQVHIVDTVGVTPDGKNAVSSADVTFGFALATSAPARAAPSRDEAHSISNP
jgi:hypothetical protein